MMLIRTALSTFVLAFLHYEFRQNTLAISYLVKRISAIPLLLKKTFTDYMSILKG